MRVSETTCGCGRAVHEGAFLCQTCVRTLDVAFANVAAYHDDLETLRTKQARYGTAGSTKGSVGKAQPLGIDLRFVATSNATGDSGDQVPGREGQGSALDAEVRNALTTWVRVCLEEWSYLTTPADRVPAMCAFFQGFLTAIAGQSWADELLREMLRLERALARMVDRPAERWYAGKCSAVGDDHNGRTCDCACHDGREVPCDVAGGCGLTFEPTPCQRELYAHAESGKIRCSACGTEHDVAERREFLLKEAEDYAVTATEAAGALIAWTDYDGSETKLVDLIRKWRDRDRLEVQDVTSLQGKDRHLYRLGDIQELLVQHAQREQARRMRRTA